MRVRGVRDIKGLRSRHSIIPAKRLRNIKGTSRRRATAVKRANTIKGISSRSIPPPKGVRDIKGISSRSTRAKGGLVLAQELLKYELRRNI